MAGWRIGTALAAVAMLALAQSAGAQDTGFAERFREELYAGRTAAAAELARAELAGAPADGTAQAALGVAEFLGTVEGLVQGLHRYGLNNGGDGYRPMAMAGLPFLRLPVPDNPNPEPVSYEKLRGLLGDFGDGLAGAERTLAATGDRPVTLELDLARIRLDLDGDGTSQPGEDLMSVFVTVAGPVQDADDRDGVQVDFDSADVVWLQAYAHVLMAMTDFLLGYDWHDAYDATFEGLFPRSFTPKTAMNAYFRGAPQRLAELEAQMPPVPDCQLWKDDGIDEACQKLHNEYANHPAVREMAALQNATEQGWIADIVAFVHLLRWPVAEPERLASSLGHLEQMVVLSRENWRRILAETDHGREWLPAPGQQGVFAMLTIDQARVDGWLGFLDQFEKVLKGESLLPHWRFAQGFNLRRMFLEPTTFDVVMLAQGHAMLPYLEDGPIADAATWSRATEVFGGDFFSYFLWIN